MGRPVGGITRGNIQQETDSSRSLSKTQWKGREVILLVAGFGAVGSGSGFLLAGPLGAIAGAIVGIAVGVIYAGYMIYHSDNEVDAVGSRSQGVLAQRIVDGPSAGGSEPALPCIVNSVYPKSEDAGDQIAANIAEAKRPGMSEAFFNEDFPAEVRFAGPIPSNNPRFSGKSYVDMFFDGSANAIDEVLSQIRKDGGRIQGNSNSNEFQKALEQAEEPARTHMLFASSQNIELALRAWLVLQLRYQGMQTDGSWYQVSQNSMEESDFTKIVHDISKKQTEITARFKVQKFGSDGKTVDIVERFEVNVIFDWATAEATINKRPISL